ncbi:MAG: hypothetical protein HC806_03795 [Anaerolineae bacterium]|nr:hypothetical protein [Anaerolineae bacterium]
MYEPTKKILKTNLLIRLFLLLLFGWVLLNTFEMNAPYPGFFVVMKESWHGASSLFLLTGLSGTFFLLFLATFIPQNKVFRFRG